MQNYHSKSPLSSEVLRYDSRCGKEYESCSNADADALAQENLESSSFIFGTRNSMIAGRISCLLGKSSADGQVIT